MKFIEKFLVICFLSCFSVLTYSQYNHYFYFTKFWLVMDIGMGYSIEKLDINRDGNDDIFVGNYRTTYLYYGGPGILDTTKDLIFKGRCLCILDYNGDGYKDMVCMNLTTYDSSRHDYNGEILYYMGSDTTLLLIDTIPDYVFPLPTLYPHQQDLATNNHINPSDKATRTGDFNNDGKQDFVISSPDWPYSNISTSSSKGKLYIYG